MVKEARYVGNRVSWPIATFVMADLRVGEDPKVVSSHRKPRKKNGPWRVRPMMPNLRLCCHCHEGLEEIYRGGGEELVWFLITWHRASPALITIPLVRAAFSVGLDART